MELGRRAALAMIGGGLVACARPPAATPSAAPARTMRTLPETGFVPRLAYPPLPPLGDDVYDARRARVLELARGAGADVVVATAGAANFAYLAGGDFGRSERLIAIVLSLGGAPAIVAPSFEVARVKQRVRNVEVIGWEEKDDPIAAIAQRLGAAGTHAKVLVEPRTDYAVAAALGRALPEAKLLDGTPAFAALRAVKSAAEIARMRRAVEITEDAFAATFDQLAAGMTEKDVAKIVSAEHARRGADGGALVQFGANAALPHGGPTATPLADETAVLIDGGCSFQGWQSDVTRTRWFGRAPSARFVALYDLVHDAQTAAIARVRPGVAAQEIDRAARDVIARGGFGAQFTHRLGHGIGMEGHEPVYMVEGNTQPLEVGLVFSVEPGIYLPGEIGVRLEDQVACGPGGAELLTRRALRLR